MSRTSGITHNSLAAESIKEQGEDEHTKFNQESNTNIDNTNSYHSNNKSIKLNDNNTNIDNNIQNRMFSFNGNLAHIENNSHSNNNSHSIQENIENQEEEEITNTNNLELNQDNENDNDNNEDEHENEISSYSNSNSNKLELETQSSNIQTISNSNITHITTNNSNNNNNNLSLNRIPSYTKNLSSYNINFINTTTNTMNFNSNPNNNNINNINNESSNIISYSDLKSLISERNINPFDIKVNDIVKVYLEKEEKLHNAKILQIKLDDNFINNNKRLFYVHFLEKEKRMDNWIEKSIIMKVLGSSDTVNSFKYINDSYSYVNENNTMLTRKRSAYNELIDNNEDHSHNQKIKNLDVIIIGYFTMEPWYYSPYPKEFCNKKILHICEYCLKYMKQKKSLLKHYVSLSLNAFFYHNITYIYLYLAILPFIPSRKTSLPYERLQTKHILF